MLLLFVDLLLLTLLLLGLVFAVQKVLRLGREDKINSALAEQKLAKELAEKASKINPEEINNNKAKVEETLSKLN